MPTTEHFDILIVGGGKAGKTLAADLGSSGHHVALIEKGMIGGACINVGCIPSKALVHCAKIAHIVNGAAKFGTHIAHAMTSMPEVLAYKRSVVAGLVEFNRQKLIAALGDRFMIGEARFSGPRMVDVRPNDGGPQRRLKCDKLFINLGAEPDMPRVSGINDVRPLTSQDALELDRLPDHLLIIGGGYIAVELGQVFRRLGSAVTIVQRGPHLLPAEDVDVSEAVRAILAEDGIEVLSSVEVLGVEGRSGERVVLRARGPDGERTLTGSDLLVAVGRVPRTRDIGIETAGVQLNDQGFISVNDRLETSAPQTWALGDCAGSPQQTHVSLDDYRIVKANVFGAGGRSTKDRLIPHTVFMDPELGRVGLTERQARDRNLNIKVAKVPISAVPRAQTMGEDRGFIKAVVDADTNLILGFVMLGPHAGEVAAVVQTAMLGRLPYTIFRDGLLAHPTMAESLNYVFSAPMS